jgi:hypothetical protein
MEAERLAHSPRTDREDPYVKLRLLDDSIRLRLSQGEVQTAEHNGSVEGQTRFPGGKALIVALESTDATTASASLEGNRLVVGLPAQEIGRWANDDTAVSLHGEVALADGSQLTLLVEKDFRCITPREGEDQSDLFPNPASSC